MTELIKPEDIARGIVRTVLWLSEDTHEELYEEFVLSVANALSEERQRVLEDCIKIVERVSLEYTDDITGRAGETIKRLRAFRKEYK